MRVAKQALYSVLPNTRYRNGSTVKPTQIASRPHNGSAQRPPIRPLDLA
jgi:hypothetical protein